MKCPNCGKHVNPKAKFCLHCGHPLQTGVSDHVKTPHKKFHVGKKRGWIITGIVIVVLLIVGGFTDKEYFSPARALSRQLPKSTWVESHHAKVIHHKKNKRLESKTKKVRHRLVVSNGSQLLSFKKNKKTVKVFKTLSGNSSKAKQLRSNLSRNMKNLIIQDHFSYHIKNDGLHFKNGITFNNVQRSRKGFTFKCYKGKKFLYTGHLKVYKSLPSSIK